MSSCKLVDGRITIEHGMAQVSLTSEEYYQIAAGLVAAAEAEAGELGQWYHVQAMLFSALGVLAEPTRHMEPAALARLAAFASGREAEGQGSRGERRQRDVE